jgi:Bifunctional DNA primase/polymerase, N-terminal
MSIHLSQTVQNGLTVYPASLVACAAGMSVVPIRPDGSKRPACRWRIYQQRRAKLFELTRWFRGTSQGLALITGAISGGLEALDFDTRESYQAWSERVQEAELATLHTRLTEGYLEATPHGIHLLYRCPRLIEGNQKLAKVPVEGPQRWQTLIETRGEGGLVVVAPSCGGVHPSGKPYVLLQGGIATIATITPAERQALLAVARSFDVGPPPPVFRQEPGGWSARARQGNRIESARPGDRYNQETSWEEVLVPHGWRLLYTHDGEGYWQRPGKDGPGISATTNYQGSDRLYVFSTSTVFEAGRAYSKFAAYTFLEHQGDFSAAARSLAAQDSPESR